jgi:3-hydroxybutyryl-CoA dehydrogenase
MMYDIELIRARRTRDQSKPAGVADGAVAVVGGGLMGSGIAEVVARAGLEVHVVDVKRDVFRALDACLPEDALIASNTSSVPIAELARVTRRPGQVLGLHFFSPAPVMPLVEVVAALETTEETLAEANAFVLALGKTAIPARDRAGFIVNTLLVPYLLSAIRMYENGFAPAEAIDTGMRLGCGHPMGPLALCDMIGLDVLYAICDSLYEEFRQPQYAAPPLLKRMVAARRLGRKTGRGFYSYEGLQAAG